jgi:hypothetical protein
MQSVYNVKKYQVRMSTPKKRPNKKTRKAMEEVRKKKTSQAKDFKALCGKLGI